MHSYKTFNYSNYGLLGNDLSYLILRSIMAMMSRAKTNWFFFQTANCCILKFTSLQSERKTNPNLFFIIPLEWTLANGSLPSVFSYSSWPTLPCSLLLLAVSFVTLLILPSLKFNLCVCVCLCVLCNSAWHIVENSYISVG